MKLNRFVFCMMCLAAGATVAYAQHDLAPQAQQQVGDFSLSGFGENGSKSWDLTGKQADISLDTIKLNDIKSNFYSTQDTVKLTAREGDFNRREGSLHVEKDVVVATSSGARLTTNALDWDRKKDLVSTAEPVNIQKDGIVITAQGAKAYPDLKKVNLQKDVQVNIPLGSTDGAPGQPRGTIVITCDGPMEMDYQKDEATFQNKVEVQTQDGLIRSDTLEVYFSKKAAANPTVPAVAGSNIEQIVARGNVTITREKNVSYSDVAVYAAADRKITLSGKPRLVLYQPQEQKNNALTGN